MSQRIQTALTPYIKRYLKQALGATTDDPGYPSIQWLRTRIQAARHLQSIYRGLRIEWDRGAHAWCVPFDLSGPGKQEVLIRTIVSAISPGTESAFFSGKPNTSVKWPFYPGYSLAGEVIAVGQDVTDFTPGQIVVSMAPHASMALQPTSKVFAVPSGVRPEEAAFFQLGIIAYNGVLRSEIKPGMRVAVFGRGIIGQLVVQLARACGAGEVISIAPSRRHITPSLSRFADRILVTNEDAGALEGLQVDIAYEVAGDSSALADAIAVTRDGGRVVLSGSPRDIARGFDFGALADRNITLIGAHINTLSNRANNGGRDYRRAGAEFLQFLAEGKLDIQSLITSEVDPWEAGWFYRQLATGDLHCIGAIFRWDQLEMQERMQPVQYWSRPDMDALRGTAMFQPPPLEVIPVANGHAPSLSQTVRTASQTGILGFAVIGCGERGALNATAVQQTPQAELVMVMDVNETLARNLGTRLGVPWTTDYAAVLNNPRVGAVFINTPHHLHADQAVQAAHAGKHIVVEKPMATTLEDATRMVQAARDCRVQLGTWLGKRYLPHMLKAKQLVDAGALGELLGARLDVQMYKPPTYWRADWRSRWASSGGGVLVMNAIHYLDWMILLGGQRVREVSARYATLDSPAEVEDTIALWLTFENGALATTNASSCVQVGRSEVVDLRVWGSDGHLVLSPPYRFFSSRRVNGNQPERWRDLGELPPLRHKVSQMSVGIEFLERFTRAVLDDTPFEISPEYALHLQAIIEAAYRSAREGQAIAIQSTAV